MHTCALHFTMQSGVCHRALHSALRSGTCLHVTSALCGKACAAVLHIHSWRDNVVQATPRPREYFLRFAIDDPFPSLSRIRKANKPSRPRPELDSCARTRVTADISSFCLFQVFASQAFATLRVLAVPGLWQVLTVHARRGGARCETTRWRFMGDRRKTFDGPC